MDKRRRLLILALLITATVGLTLAFILPGIGEDHFMEQVGLACIPLTLGTAGTLLYLSKIKKGPK